MCQFLREKLEEHHVKGEVNGRVKNLYSIYRKLQAQQITLDEVYDLLAFRIIVETVQECYETLGVIHALFRPVPGRLKDYIGMPKGNMYQSIHTTVIGQDGERLEIQIRTREMHRVAEEGIAAHWSYKERRAYHEKDAKRFTWLKQMVDLQKELKNPQELLEGVRLELYPDEVYAFTPTGDVKELPRAPPWWILPMPSTRKWGISAPAPRSMAAWCPCAPNCRMATRWRSLPRPTTPPAGTGSSSSRPPRPGTRSASGSRWRKGNSPWPWARNCWSGNHGDIYWKREISVYSKQSMSVVRYTAIECQSTRNEVIMLIEGKTAVITGCNRGIGKVILETFAANGADIIACARKESAEFSDHINMVASKYSVRITPVYFDLGETDQIKDAVRTIIAMKRQIDILVNNAGVASGDYFPYDIYTGVKNDIRDKLLLSNTV